MSLILVGMGVSFRGWGSGGQCVDKLCFGVGGGARVGRWAGTISSFLACGRSVENSFVVAVLGIVEKLYVWRVA